MKEKYHTYLSLLFVGSLIVCLSTNARAAVTVGMPRDQVIDKMGAPNGNLATGTKEILLYPNGLTVELRDGVVSAVKQAPVNRRESGDPKHGGASRPAAAAKPVPAGLPAPFVPGITQRAKVPVIQVNWSKSPYTTDMFSVKVSRRKDWPPLHRITGRGALARLAKALADGADIKAVDPVGRTALHRYVEPWLSPHEAVKQMKLLIEHGSDINARDSLGQTPLHDAARHSHSYAQVKFLIEAGADLDARDKAGRTPLHLAAAEGNTSALDLLIAAGADTAIVDATGATPADIIRERARWLPRQKVSGTIKSLCFGNNRFIACGPFMKSILISTDGAHWRPEPAPAQRDLASVAFVGNGFVGWATHRGVFGSRDGVKWETLDAPDSPIYFDHIAVGRDRAVAMGRSATVLHSRDGRAWQSLREGVCAYTLGVGWLGDRFVAVNRDGMVFSSYDGLNWGKAKLDLKGLKLKGARCVNGELFGVGYGGLMIRSKNGVDWRQVPIPVMDPLNDIAWGRGMYVAVGDNGTILLSEDGNTWRLRRPSGASQFSVIAFGNNTFVTAGRGTIWSSHP